MKKIFIINLVALLLMQLNTFAQSSERVYVWTSEEENMDIYKSVVGDTTFVMEAGSLEPLFSVSLIQNISTDLGNLPSDNVRSVTRFVSEQYYSSGSYIAATSWIIPGSTEYTLESYWNHDCSWVEEVGLNGYFGQLYEDCGLDYKPFRIERMYVYHDHYSPIIYFNDRKLSLLAFQRYLVEQEGTQSRFGIYESITSNDDVENGAPEYNGFTNDVNNFSNDNSLSVFLSRFTQQEFLLYAMFYASEIAYSDDTIHGFQLCDYIEDLDDWLNNIQSTFITGNDKPLEEFTIKNIVNIFPNPVIEEINIKTAHSNIPIDVRVYDLSSNLVLSHRITSDLETINLSILKAGIYIISIEKEGVNQIHYEKIIKI